MKLRYDLPDNQSVENNPPTNGPHYIVSGAPSPGAHRLIFCFYFSGWPSRDLRVLDGHLLLSGPDSVPHVGRAYLRPDGTSWNTGERFTFELELDSRQVERLCDRRGPAGSSMRLRADIVLLVSGPLGVQRVSADEILSIPPSMWFESLTAAGFGDTLVSEITIPRAEVEPGLAAAIGALREAVTAFRETSGNDARARDAVSTCRLAFEGGVLDTDKHALLPSARATEAMTKDERLRALRWAVKLVGHLPHHVPTVKWSKRDARLMTLVTAALVEWEAGHD